MRAQPDPTSRPPAPSRGVHHIGFTVPDIDEAIRFFEAVFGCVHVLSTGPFEVAPGFMERRLGTAPGARLRDLAYLRCGDSANIELFQFDGDPGGEYVRTSACGSFHIAFQVDDAHAAGARLREAGLDMLEGPYDVTDGPFAGLTCGYLRAPWGQYLELFSYHRLGAGDATGARLFKPR